MDAAATGQTWQFPIIYVHGLGPKPPAEQLKRDWDWALFDPPVAARTRMAYWADILHPGHESMPPASAAPPPAWRLALERQARAPRPTGDPHWRNWAAEFVTRRLIPDVAAYFFIQDVRAAIQTRFAQQILAEAKACIVVAHSMGSIVAYDVLHALGDAVDVPLWITLGSPLGFAAVQDHLARPLMIPRGVREWRNFADRFDPVALDRSLAGDFKPTGRIHDQLIINCNAVSADGIHPHSVTGYLRHPSVRAAVLQALEAGRGTAAGL